MMELKNIVFDMGNVLVRFAPDEMLSAFPLTAEERALFIREVFLSPVWSACDRGDDVRARLLRPVMDRLPPKLARLCEELCVPPSFESRFLPPVEGMEQVVSPLLARGYRLYVLSNAGEGMRRLTDNMPILRDFSGIYISCEHHLLKPDPAIFRSFCAAFSLVPESCLFIDDSEANVLGARSVGMQGLRFSALETSAETLKKELFARLAGEQI